MRAFNAGIRKLAKELHATIFDFDLDFWTSVKSMYDPNYEHLYVR